MTGQLVDLPEYYSWGEELTETRSQIQVSTWECWGPGGGRGGRAWDVLGIPEPRPSISVTLLIPFLLVSALQHHIIESEWAEISLSGKGGGCEESGASQHTGCDPSGKGDGNLDSKARGSSQPHFHLPHLVRSQLYSAVPSFFPRALLPSHPYHFMLVSSSSPQALPPKSTPIA